MRLAFACVIAERQTNFVKGRFAAAFMLLHSIMKQAVFIERDAVLTGPNGQKQQHNGTAGSGQIQINDGAAALISRLKSAGFLVIATTNQPGISRGELSRRELDRVHDRMRKVLSLDDILVCPHDEADRCPCRKPKPGLLVEAGFKWRVDLDRSFVISEKWQDAETARITGATSLLIESPFVGKVHRDFLVPDFATAVEKILDLKGAARAALA